MAVNKAKLHYEGDRVIISSLTSPQQFFFSASAPPLGRGGMGEVYVGRDNHNNRVAIKRVRPEWLHLPQVVERARAEGGFLYSHPALIEMFGSYEVYNRRGGIDEIFIISRYVEGQPLSLYVNNVVNRKPDRVLRVCRLLEPVMDALAFLHGHNLVHLDIKPSNIMIEAERQVKLMDLGITTRAGKAYDTGKDSGMVGTPQYASPEQCYDGSNSALDVDSRADIYALGITLAEFLTGQTPERNDNGTLKHLKGVPTPVAKVIRRATMGDRERRYQTVEEMRADLRRAVNKKSVPWLWIALGAAVTLSVIAIILTLLS